MRMIDAIDRSELRGTIQGWRDAHADVDDADGVDILDDVLLLIDAQSTLTPPNEPLTIEQLREMDGEPVWVVLVDEKFSGLNGWYLVHHGSAYLARIDDWELDDDKYGVEWLAYRRPPEGEEDT